MRRPVVWCVAVAALVAVGIGSWFAWTSMVASSLEVAWQGEPVCSGTDLARDAHTIRAEAEMSCVITVEVRNAGRQDVHLDTAVLPYLGPDGGSVLEAAEIDGRQPTADGRDTVDARVELGHDLGAGDTWTFRTLVVFRDDGCTDAGTGHFDGWPAVRFEALGRDGSAAAPDELAYTRRSQNPGCTMR